MPKPKLPITITNHCYIGMYDNNYCLFYKDVPLIMVKYPFGQSILMLCVIISTTMSRSADTLCL